MINNVHIVPGCIACRNCEKICPKVFKVEGQSKVISQDTNGIEDKVLEAARMCPVQVIKVDHDGGTAQKNIAYLTKKVLLTPDIIELTFEVSEFTYTPGQYITLFMEDKKWSFSRAYSIADAGTTWFTLTVKLHETWRWSLYLTMLPLWEKGKAEYLWPHWFFTLQTPTKSKLFIGTWTWLAPLYAMARVSASTSKSKLLIWARTLEDHYRLDKLGKIKNLQVDVVVSQPKAWYKWLKGRVTDYLEDAKNYDEFYLCGNPDMVHQVRTQLQEQGIPENVIYEEVYTPWVDIKPESEFTMRTLNWLLIGMSWWFPVAFLFWKQYAVLRDISWWTVVLLMSIRPLADLISGRWFLRRAVVLRQGLGIMSSMIVVTMLAYTAYTSQGEFWLKYTDPAHWSLTGFALLSRLTEITAVILLLTSNRFSQKLFGKWWKKIHKIAYIYFYAAGIYIVSLGKIEALRSMGFVTLLLIVASIRNRYR